MSEQVGIADKNYWLDKDGNVTTDEAESAFWIVHEGSPITREMADIYGIGKVAQPEEEAAEKTVKAAKSSENKAQKAKEDK